MLYTNYYGCCRLFQTTIKSCMVPNLKSTNLNYIQVTTLTCCNIQVKQLYADYVRSLLCATLLAGSVAEEC